MRGGVGKICDVQPISCCISVKCEIGTGVLLITNRKSYTGSRLTPSSMTLNDLERQNREFYGFFGDFGLRQVYSIRKVAPRNSNLLCDPDRVFDICILT